ncbi:hypothetical protein [Pseudoclavibacter sp. RFBB5]|nr:hypothetical protein [Pseudoclavibacter sp. RFBB5]
MTGTDAIRATGTDRYTLTDEGKEFVRRWFGAQPLDRPDIAED